MFQELYQLYDYYLRQANDHRVFMDEADRVKYHQFWYLARCCERKLRDMA